MWIEWMTEPSGFRALSVPPLLNPVSLHTKVLMVAEASWQIAGFILTAVHFRPISLLGEQDPQVPN